MALTWRIIIENKYKIYDLTWSKITNGKDFTKIDNKMSAKSFKKREGESERERERVNRTHKMVKNTKLKNKF